MSSIKRPPKGVVILDGEIWTVKEYLEFIHTGYNKKPKHHTVLKTSREALRYLERQNHRWWEMWWREFYKNMKIREAKRKAKEITA